MTQGDTQRMILQRSGPQAETSSAAESRIEAAPGVDLIDRASTSSLLVEGLPAAIEQVVRGLPGWSALPVKTYPRPETRRRVLRPADD